MATDTILTAERKPLAAYRELFPVTKRQAYLNHSALGTLATPVVAALGEHIRQQSERGAAATPTWAEPRRRTREKMARFVNADPSEMAVVKNTPEALGIVATGLRWLPGDKVVLSDLEFPANAFPWLNLRSRGVQPVIVRAVDGAVPTETVIDAIDDRTRLVALSWIQFSTGYRSDLQAIGQACRERGALLAVDAIQGLGALRLDVRALGIDFFGAASHKWLLGPTGVGWFFCRRELIGQLDLAIVGQGSYQRDERTSWLDYSLPLWEDARRFEPGIANFLGLAGLEATLDLLLEVGQDRIEAQVKRLSDLLADGLAERGYRLAAPRGAAWSGVVSFKSDRHTSEELYAGLGAAGVAMSLREGLIRLSPHFYNSEEDVERFFAALST